MILKRLMNKTPPQEVEKRVFQILEEDSEEFVVKLWRFIIFEIHKIKNGII
jgi:RNA-binding protein 25